MVPVAACTTLRSVDRSPAANPMLSLSSSAYQTSLCRAQPITDVFSPYLFPADNGFQFSPLLHGAKGLPVVTSIIEPRVSGTEVEKSINRDPRVTIDARQPLLDPSCHLTNSRPEFPCQPSKSQMNGSDGLKMTGSSSQRAEQLSWLADVATGAVSSRGVSNLTASSTDHEKNGASVAPIHHNSDSNSRSSLGPMLLGSNPSNPRVYTPSFQSERLHLPPPTQHHHQTSTVSGTGLSLYYSQAPRNTPYTNFYHADYRPSMPYHHPCISEGVSQPRLSRPYFQSNTYSPTLTSMANVPLQSAHTQLPHSPGYLHSVAISSSPIGFASSPSSPHGRMSLTSCNVPLSRSVEEQISQEQNSHLTLQVLGHRGSPQFLQEERRSSYKSPEPNLASKGPSPARDAHPPMYSSDSSSSKETRQNPSPSHLTYKVPTGKEGSLKHRILRPPSINIVEPPHAILDAPLSAPPIRTHREPSPKQLRQDTYRSISTSSDFLLDNYQTHILSQHEAPRLSPSFVVPTDSTTVPVSASNPPNPAACGPQNLKYPPAFMKGSIIQLANSQLKPVEQMTTEDFMECEALSSNLKIDSSTVISIEKMPSSGSAKLGFSVGQNKLQITVEAPLEHPFFVYKQGWSSCSPERSLLRYGLTCHKLKVGDTCIFLTVKSEQQPPTARPCLSTRSSSSVPTSASHYPTNSSVSVCLGTPKGEIVQCVTSKALSCSLGFNSNTRDKSIKTDSLQNETKLVTVPSSFLQNAVSASSSVESAADSSSSSTTPRKRKRRWSAPGQVTLDPPCPSS